MNPSDIAIENFAEVGKLAIKQELKMRLLANKTEAIKGSAFDKRFGNVEEAVIQYFRKGNHISQFEIDILTKSRQIRNKILHCEFDAAIKLIEEYNQKSLTGPSIKVLHVGDLSGEDLLTKIKNFDLHARPVEQMNKQDAGIFGWLLQINQKGGFEEAFKIFNLSNKIIEGLIAIDP